MTRKSGRGDKVLLKVRLDYQVEYGESVVIAGSSKELGSWQKKFPLNWSEDGWICDLELKGDESVEFKFTVVRKDKSEFYELGDNRIVQLPKVGRFSAVCQWNKTWEAVEMLPLDTEEDVEGDEEEQDEAGNGFVVEVEASLFVGQWKGKAISQPGN